MRAAARRASPARVVSGEVGVVGGVTVDDPARPRSVARHGARRPEGVRVAVLPVAAALAASPDDERGALRRLGVRVVERVVDPTGERVVTRGVVTRGVVTVALPELRAPRLSSERSSRSRDEVLASGDLDGVERVAVERSGERTDGVRDGGVCVVGVRVVGVRSVGLRDGGVLTVGGRTSGVEREDRVAPETPERDELDGVRTVVPRPVTRGRLESEPRPVERPWDTDPDRTLEREPDDRTAAERDDEPLDGLMAGERDGEREEREMEPRELERLEEERTEGARIDERLEERLEERIDGRLLEERPIERLDRLGEERIEERLDRLDDDRPIERLLEERPLDDRPIEPRPLVRAPEDRRWAICIPSSSIAPTGVTAHTRTHRAPPARTAWRNTRRAIIIARIMARSSREVVAR